MPTTEPSTAHLSTTALLHQVVDAADELKRRLDGSDGTDAHARPLKDLALDLQDAAHELLRATR